MIFGINGKSDISKLLYVISRAVRRVKFETILNITSGIYAKNHIQIMLLFVYTTTCKWFVIFPCRYFKLSWNTTALSRSNCRNFSCSGITIWMHRSQFHFFLYKKSSSFYFENFDEKTAYLSGAHEVPNQPAPKYCKGMRIKFTGWGHSCSTCC